jgi:hypothetical protein
VPEEPAFSASAEVAGFWTGRVLTTRSAAQRVQPSGGSPRAEWRHCASVSSSA